MFNLNNLLQNSIILAKHIEYNGIQYSIFNIEKYSLSFGDIKIDLSDVVIHSVQKKANMWIKFSFDEEILTIHLK